MVQKCKKSDCPLFKQREVPYGGYLKSSVVLLGESPGKNEEKEGKPFVGAAGKLAQECCKEAGIPFHRLAILNSARCRILKDELPEKEISVILSHCRSYIETALKKLKPKAIIAAGAIALNQLAGKKKKHKITKVRGTWMWSEEFNCWIMPTFHPAYILRNQSFRPILVDDLKIVKNFIKNGFKIPKISISDLDHSEVDDISDFLNSTKITAIDTEGQGLEWSDPNYVCISVSLSNKESRAVDVVLWEECEREQADHSFEWMRIPDGKKKAIPTEIHIKKAKNFETKMRQIQELCESKITPKVTMNGNFDKHVLRTIFKREGIDLKFNNFVMDIQAAANLIDENIYKQSDLTSLQRAFANFKDDYNREFALKYNKADMLSVPKEARTTYAALDASVTRQAALSIIKWMAEAKHKKIKNYHNKFTVPALEFLSTLEENGCYIDQKALPITMDKIEHLMRLSQKKALIQVPKKVFKMTDHVRKNKAKMEKDQIVLTRDDLVRDILFSKKGFGLKSIKKTKNKQPSIDKEVRTKLFDQRLSPKALEFVKQFNLFSEYHTLWSRYLRGFEKHIKPWDNLIHSSYSLTTTVTGRIASRSPNLMNNPKRSQAAKEIRRLIAAPPGYLLMAADMSQSELRFLAHVARDPVMIKIFSEGKIDIHTATAQELTGKAKWATLTKDEMAVARRNAKICNFGLIYGMSLWGFIRYAKLEYGIELTEPQAEAWINIFFRKYPRLKTYHKIAINFCREHGYIDTILGRRRRLPEINSYDKWLKGEAERQAINAPIQGPSSDAVILAGIEIMRTEPNPEEFRPTLFIHDELIFLVKDNSKVTDYGKLFHHHMTNPPLERDFGVKLLVPLESEVKVGKNSLEMEELKL